MVVAPDESSYQAMLERRGARRDQTADEYEAFLDVQEYRSLASIDVFALGRAFSILRS